MPCRDSRSHDAGAVRKPRKDAVMLSCGKGTYLKRKTESHHPNPSCDLDGYPLFSFTLI